MDKYIQALNAFLAEDAPLYTLPDESPLSAKLYRCYQQRKGADTAAVRAYFEDMYALLKQTAPGQADAVTNDIYKFCNAYERQAFREGFAVGLHLYTQLHNQSDR